MKTKLQILAGTLAASAAVGVAFLVPVFALAAATNGSFENGTNPGSYTTLTPGNTNITDWSIDSGSVDYIGTYWQAADGTRSVDLNGLEAGSISQTFPTVVGATYNVTFDLSGNPDGGPSLKDVQVSATGATPQDFTYDTSVKGNTLADMKWQPETYSFTATATNTTLTFASQIAGAFGPALDNISIPTGAIEITKYACPSSTVVTRASNGVGGTVPAGCVPQSGMTFGYVHGTQTDANAPFPELSAPLTAGGSTDGSGVLTIADLPADGRYLVVETNDSNQQLAAGDILGLYCEGDGDTSNTNDNQELTFVPADGATHCVAYDKAATPATVTVTIEKFLDKVAASTTSTTASFPMSATWSATNIGAGTGSYALSTVGFNSPNAYEAVTADMTAGADYSTNEVTGGAVVGTDCSTGQPYALSGYSYGPDLATAEAAAKSTTTPSFTNLTQNEVVIVWNKLCVPMPVHLSPADGSTLTTAALVKIDWTDVTDPALPITYLFQSSNASTTNPDGSFTTPVYTSGPLAVSEIPTPGTPAGVYYWHVRAVDNDGNMSPWTAAWKVTVDNTPPAPPAPPADACSTLALPSGYTLKNGTAGSDTVTLAPFTMFIGHGGNDKVTAPDGNYIICTGKGNDTISIGNGDYTISDEGGNNTITTGNGAGPITTGAGNDTITTGNGAHTINAGGGNNTIMTGDGDQNITTLAGNDKITTGGGNDTINAGDGNNTVKAGAGDDTITAGSGNDIIDGGPGTDTCHAGGGLNTVTNCEL